MNYLRGALQYYKDLPPINASTLTGAIDVIVVRRPGEDSDDELASTPFHVRFGKWQVLRPGDKKVIATVNGKPMPFNMKIGLAGEAFFVFETDEDVSEELITSPITSPRITPSNSTHGTMGEASAEPEPLDLDENNRTPALPSHASETGPISRVVELGTTLVAAATEEAQERIDNIKDELKLLSNAAQGVSAMDDAVEESKKAAEASKPRVSGDGRVLLDTSGYHLNIPEEPEPLEEDEEKSLRPQNRYRVQSITSSRGSTPMSISRANSPSFTDASSPTSPTSVTSKLGTFARGRSEPPELHLSNLSTSLPNYEWEWGSFPQPSPTVKMVFDPLQTRAASVPPDLEAPSESGETVTLEPDEVMFGLGGLLKPDTSDPYQFVLELGGVDLRFEMSLCGEHPSESEFVMSDNFNKTRVSYRKAMAKPSVVREEHLIIKWGDKFVSRQDASPLFGALLHWRENTISSQGYTSDGEPLSSGDESTDDEDSKPKTQTNSGWTSWWRRGWTGKTSTQKKRGSVFDLEYADSALQKPPLLAAHSEPDLGEPVPEKPPETRPVESTAPAPPAQPPVEKQKRFAKTLRLTSEQLKQLELRPGPNEMKFTLSNPEVPVCTARIFLWDHSEHIVVSDIDGTITKSDALGHVLTLIGRDWTHLGVAKLYTDIVRNGYKIMYLTSRAIGQADSTRDYLKGINQNNYQLPEGPVIMSPDRLMASLHREVIMRKPEVFKMACLRDIARLFGNTSRNPFYAGFGNRITDALSYRSVNIPSTRIFTIDSTGEVKCELLEKAGYKSSYIHMNDLVDQQFPPIHRRWQPEYTDFNFWRAMPDIEIELPNFAPPSPTAGTQSETSSTGPLTRLRQFSLGRTAPRPLTVDSQTPRQDLERDSHLRSMSSVERLRSLVGLSSDALSIPETEEEIEQKARRRLSTSGSMPGSLPGEGPNFPFEDEEAEEEKDLEANEQNDEGEEEDEEEEASYEDELDEMFDEDLRTTDKMKDVPFL